MKRKRTRRDKFLAGRNTLVPWARLTAVIEPLYPTSGRMGRQPIGTAQVDAHEVAQGLAVVQRVIERFVDQLYHCCRQ